MGEVVWLRGGKKILSFYIKKTSIARLLEAVGRHYLIFDL